jgi:hypothetical protein
VGGAGITVYFSRIKALFSITNSTKRSYHMSDAKPVFTRPKVPDGHAFRVTTRQKEIVPGQFFVGYETTWEPIQKEVPYETPKKP